jgi:hypothetical protein
MTIRLRIWLGAMVCAALLLTGLGLLTPILGGWPVAGAIVLVLFAPIAWLLAWLAYAPVRDVAETTRSITTTGELDRRCFYAGPRDDVGSLVVAVNELLVRHDAAIGRIRRLQANLPARGCPGEDAAPDPADLVLGLPRSRDLTPRPPRRAGEAEPGDGTPDEVSRPGS